MSGEVRRRSFLASVVGLLSGALCGKLPDLTPGDGTSGTEEILVRPPAGASLERRVAWAMAATRRIIPPEERPFLDSFDDEERKCLLENVEEYGIGSPQLAWAWYRLQTEYIRQTFG